jgi:hypothetical protein
MNISLPVSNPTPFEDSLLGSTNDLIMQSTVSTPSIELVHEELKGGAKGKKTVSKKDKKEKKVKKDKKAPTEKKRVKEIDTFKKPQLEKIAKKHDISLKGRDGKLKTKEQLFKSLKRKNLV